MANATPFRGASWRRNGASFNISLPRNVAAEVRERIKEHGLDGPSAFIQRLIVEARAARCLVMLPAERKAS